MFKLECYALWQKQRPEGIYKNQGRHSAPFFANNPKKLFSKIFKKISRFFSKFSKIRKFQTTGSNLKWMLNESWRHFKNFGWKIKFQRICLGVILHDIKISVLNDESSFYHYNRTLTTKKPPWVMHCSKWFI